MRARMDLMALTVVFCVSATSAMLFQKDNVREITIGPLLNDDIAQSNLMRMTRAYQYPVWNFHTSEVPIRY